MIYSPWKQAVGNWVTYTKDGTQTKTSFILAPEITADHMSKSAILVYARFFNDSLNVALPYTSYAGGSASTLWGQAQIEATEPVGYTRVSDGTVVASGGAVPAGEQARIRLFRFTHDNSASVGSTSTGEYRYVIVPGGIQGLSLSKIDWRNYEQVKAYLHLPD